MASNKVACLEAKVGTHTYGPFRITESQLHFFDRVSRLPGVMVATVWVDPCEVPEPTLGRPGRTVDKSIFACG